ncbi:hypothetical protein KC19_6G069600 [Ceratodon purpureus]|uniref:RRM domain-containing protein n=1 Tax=Ceratodon purpureus TaxID=3225 RepID=A0A8T0HD10_CERPU|nr:hypothetical protein KC19_6G069600 [Ceratodon purpureus]
MALSSLSFLVPHPPPDLLQASVITGSAACSRPCSLSTSSSSLWVSSERSQFVVVAGKAKRETMDFEFLDDDDGMAEEDRVPDHVDMEEWMRNRPSGFGVGKEYDLALEEKLLAEIEADRKAQEAAKRNKGSKGKITPKKPKVTEAPAGVEVWVGNLPRKRKVDRDLRAVFRNAPGLLHIRPIVEPENEKTRDPMCRGFAFFTFATEDDAYDFVSMYNGVKVKFGKVEKKVTCEVAKSDSPWHPKPDRRVISVPKLQVRDDTDYAQESRLPSTPAKKMDKKLEIETVISSATEKSFEDEEEEEEEDEASETELRAMEEEIWDQFEDEDDVALDLELTQEEDLDDEDELSQVRSAMDQDELPEPVESVRTRNTNVEETSDSKVSGRKTRESSQEEDVDEEEYSVEKIKALEAKVREMERKLQLSAQNEEERVALLEKRVLSKAKSAVGISTSKGEGEKKKAGAKKKSQAGKKTQKPKKIGSSLGSAGRLKAKERAILTGVMSKYVSSSP